MTSSQQQTQYNEVSSAHIEYNNDLADNINGLYRLLDLCNDDGSNGICMF